MRVLIVSDLHMDMWEEHGIDARSWAESAIFEGLDAFIVAGDLCNKPDPRWPRFISKIARRVPADRIYLIPGNHDYYGHCLDRDEKLKSLAESVGAKLAQMRELIIGNARFLCCTLWTDFALRGSTEEGMRGAENNMSDYSQIRMAGRGYSRMKPRDVLEVHLRRRNWLLDRRGKDLYLACCWFRGQRVKLSIARASNAMLLRSSSFE